MSAPEVDAEVNAMEKRAPIRILSDSFAARIAAGEVIERPASVVKELVENALDAGATRVDVEVSDGGRSGIAVIDNGHGIGAGEIELAFSRFATSKITDDSDLAGISTLGFRGEALPSIASVSIVEIVSRSSGEESGTRLLLEYGEIRVREGVGVPVGTTVRVRELFSNVPARRRFLSSAGGELTRVNSVVASYALARPDVALKLTADGAVRFATSGSGAVRDAVTAVYGAEAGKSMIDLPDTPPGSLQGGGSAISASGVVSAPSFSRGNRNYITLSVNGRWIKSRRISFAVEQAFHGFLPERRFPMAVVEITAPPGDMDVNVHPTKAEVKFLREQAVFGAVQKAVRSALLEHAPVAPARRFDSPRPAVGPVSQTSGAAGGLNPLWPDPLAGSPLAAAGAGDGRPGPVAPPEAGPGPAPGEQAAGRETLTPRRALPVLRLLGQAHETYLIAEGPDGIYLIDQHAAHERVLFEEISARYADSSSESQQLLVPDTVELQPSQEEALEQHSDELAALGFLIEPFGPHTVVLRAVPRVLKDRSPGESLAAILDAAAEEDGVAGWQEKMLATLACHASVTAGRKMETDEARELLRQLELTRLPHTCPHGRPTMIHMSEGSLEREFKRR